MHFKVFLQGYHVDLSYDAIYVHYVELHFLESAKLVIYQLYSCHLTSNEHMFGPTYNERHFYFEVLMQF